MKLLFVHPSVELYGADKILLYILEILHKDNEITVLLPKDGILVQYIKNISSKIGRQPDSGWKESGVLSEAARKGMYIISYRKG